MANRYDVIAWHINQSNSGGDVIGLGRRSLSSNSKSKQMSLIEIWSGSEDISEALLTLAVQRYQNSSFVSFLSFTFHRLTLFLHHVWTSLSFFFLFFPLLVCFFHRCLHSSFYKYESRPRQRPLLLSTQFLPFVSHRFFFHLRSVTTSNWNKFQLWLLFCFIGNLPDVIDVSTTITLTKWGVHVAINQYATATESRRRRRKFQCLFGRENEGQKKSKRHRSFLSLLLHLSSIGLTLCSSSCVAFVRLWTRMRTRQTSSGHMRHVDIAVARRFSNLLH